MSLLLSVLLLLVLLKVSQIRSFYLFRFRNQLGNYGYILGDMLRDSSDTGLTHRKASGYLHKTQNTRTYIHDLSGI